MSRVWDEYRGIDVFRYPESGLYYALLFLRDGRMNVYSDTLGGLHELIDAMEEQ